ncbi:MAG: ATP-binding cassette domain-containing protein [Bdellovibrionota bacterium]
MSNLIQLQKGSKAYSTKTLFNEASFSVNEGEHIGVIGPNGAGKTTLFKTLADLETLDSGEFIKSRSLRLGYLAQHDSWGPEETVEDYLSQCITPIWELKSFSKKMGLSDEIFSKPISSLSGGYRMRCKLLYLIGQEPNLMLLDEPTNYLDLETTLVLENFLQGYNGAFLLISHDREFLRRTTDHIIEVEAGDITKYNGNIDDYFEQKELLRTQLESRAMSLQEKRKEVLDFVARFGAKASKAKQAQSRLKSLDRMETIELKPISTGASIKIPAPAHAGKIVTEIKEADLGYGDKIVLKNVNFTLNNGDHVAIVGLNGAGKSTFLKALAQKLTPLRGEIELGYQVSIGYYAQHVAENLDPNSTVINEMVAKVHPDVTRQEALNMAGSLLFSGDDVQKKISVLSGGEKSRVALGQILLQKAPCLVLDEPTNHLDFQTVEALTQALGSYKGTVVVVSHDRSFIRRVGQKILEINHGQLSLYLGTYDEYVWSLEKGILSDRSSNTSKSIPTKPQAPKKKNLEYEERKSLEKELRLSEKNIIKLESSMESLQDRLNELNSKITETTGEEQKLAIEELAQVQMDFDTAEKHWFELSEKVETTREKLNP